MAKDKGKARDSKPVTTDSRFASVHSDPRFKQPKLKNAKVKVDERFSRKELDKLNAGLGGKKTKVDRYGRKIKEQESKFDKYFRESDSEESGEDEESDEEEGPSESGEQEKAKSKVSGSEDESDESDGSDESDNDVATALDRARGEGLESSSSEEEDSDSDDEEEEEIVLEESDIELEEGKPEEGDPSDTFAVVNMDWDNIRAVDLMATFSSFVPKSGLIKSITIYPSEFGKEQMQKEEIEGPPRDLFKKKQKKKQDDDSDLEEEIDTKSAAGLEKAAKKLFEEDNGEEDYDSKALRRYQLQRLRYYYAIVKCDSISTAKNIYDNCDGTEYESTANIFDLRYVPEGMDFDDSDARDTCTKLPNNYKPSLFVTDALQHSKVKLTWDETPKERLAIASRLFSQREIEDMDFKAYLASGSEDEEEEEDKESAKNKYKMLLGGNKSSSNGAESEDDVDMEISFNPGLEDQQAVKTEEVNEEVEDSLTAYKRKQKERRKARMEKFKDRQKEDKEPETKSTKKSKKHPEVDTKSKAELELLMMNENDEQEDHHFNMKDVIKSEKKKNKKHKNKKQDDENTQQDFEIDLNDDRFKEIFENRDYNIDPTNTDFKKTKTMKKILDERSKRQINHGPEKKNKKVKSTPETNELGSLVDKLKRKHKK